MIRPGPLSIEPGTAPGGVVFHVYAVPSGRLLRVDAIATGDDLEARADAAADAAHDAAGESDLCLVAYDGDTGARYTAADWTADPHPTARRLGQYLADTHDGYDAGWP